MLFLSFKTYSQSYFYYIINSAQKQIYIGYTNDFDVEKNKHINKEVLETKYWSNITLEKLEKFEDNFEASNLLNNFNSRIAKARDWEYISSKGFDKISSLLKDLNQNVDRNIKGNRLSKNYSVGKIAESAFTDIINEEKPKSEIVEQVCIDNSMGRTFVDLAFINSDNKLVFVEIKSSLQAKNRYWDSEKRLEDNSKQFQVHQQIAKSGGTVCSRDDEKLKKIGLSNGQIIGATIFRVGYFE